ncbi:YadA-like family protein [Acinetobacter baumannii]|uniref:YadA-like family protein n=1 Tax=Acinetobacter baumannii TaxID=470 RepID=UPI003A8A022F
MTTARNAVAIGSDATVSNRNSGIAIGDNAQVIVGSHINDVNGLPGSIAIGLNARSVGGSEVIIGSYAAQNAQRYDDGAKNTYGSDSVMLGNQAGRNSQYLYATFIGDQAGQNSIGQHNSYVGQNAARYRTGSYNTALGSNALTGISNTTNSTGNSNTAIGTASGVSLEGDGNTLTGVYTGQRIIGNNNSAFGNNAGANIKGNENIAIGYLSGVSFQGNNNVLLGSNSNIGVNTNNVVSIGTNTRATKENSIALGANANTVTDATLESEANLNGLTYGNFAGQVTNTGMQLSVGSAGAERQIKNVGSGSISETSPDAINGSQLYATNNILGNVANSTIDILGGDASLNSNGTLSMSNIGGTGQNTIDSAIAASRTEVEQGKNITVTSSTGVDGQNIYTVATADEVDFNKVTVGDTTITTDGIVIANGPSITKDGISAGDKKVTDVADGLISADSKDAINGSQLFGLGNNLTQLFGGNALYTNNQITWSNIGGTGQNTIDDAIKHVNDQAANANQGWNVSTDSGLNVTSTVKPGQTVNINGDSDNGVLVTNSGNDIKVGLADQIKIGAGDNAVSIDGNSGTIEAGDVLIDGLKGNISAGKVTVNGEAGTVNGLTNTTWNPNNIVSGQAATEDQLQQVAQNATVAATAAKTTVSAGENITVSSSKNADGSTNYQVATSKDVKFDTVTSGSITTDKVSVGNITIDQTGINAGGNKITNVADGTINSTSKDAINGSQLHASNTNIYNYLGGGANYETNTGPTYNVGGGSYNNVGDALTSLDQQVTNVSNQLEQAFYTTNKRIDDLEDHANGGIAQALATAGLPQAYIPGKSMMAISGGTYRGESGYAIGLSSISDNGKWVFKMTGSGNSRGDFGGTVGAGIQW